QASGEATPLTPRMLSHPARPGPKQAVDGVIGDLEAGFETPVVSPQVHARADADWRARGPAHGGHAARPEQRGGLPPSFRLEGFRSADLNVLYHVSDDPGRVVGGRRTYWNNLDDGDRSFFLYYHAETTVWVLSPLFSEGRDLLAEAQQGQRTG
ncbi:unnamed protein product, partial [Prorocentrum cordatum]